MTMNFKFKITEDDAIKLEALFYEIYIWDRRAKRTNNALQNAFSICATAAGINVLHLIPQHIIDCGKIFLENLSEDDELLDYYSLSMFDKATY